MEGPSVLRIFYKITQQQTLVLEIMIDREDNSIDGYYVGIDAGSVSLNCSVINHAKEIVYEPPYKRHLGKVEEEVLKLIHELYERFGRENIKAVAFTGNHGQNICRQMGGFYEFETISQVLGGVYLDPDVRTIISMGGQDTALFQINHDDNNWELEYFNTNGPCASGTGSFLDQQAQRLATSIYDKKVDISQDQIDGILADFIKLGLKSVDDILSSEPLEYPLRLFDFCPQSCGVPVYGLHQVRHDPPAEQGRDA